MKKFVNLNFFVVLCLTICLVWITWFFLVRHFIPSWEHRGVFGDLYGGLNTLFTGLAFAGLVFTILLQKIQLQESESQQASAEKEQKNQQFENIFFQLLNSLNQIVDSTEWMNVNNKSFKGRVYFKKLYDDLQQYYLSNNATYSQLKGKELVEKAYGSFYATYENDLGHYFRTLYHIFKFIDRSDIEDKKFYAGLVRAQLSSQQLLLLFYNCFTPEGAGFKDYVQRYALLKHLPKNLIQDKSLLDFYSTEAYGV